MADRSKNGRGAALGLLALGLAVLARRGSGTDQMTKAVATPEPEQRRVTSPARRRRWVPTPALAVATVALVAAIGGGAALALPGENTVDSQDIINEEVKAPDLGDDAVKPRHVADDTVRGRHIDTGAVRATDIASGAVGSAEVDDNSLRSIDILESSLSKVPNADELDGLDSTQLTGVATVSNANDSLVGVSGDALTLNVTAPADGFLFIVASSDVFVTGGNTDTSVICQLELDGTDVSASAREISLDNSSADTDTNGEEDCNTNTVQPVTAGAHTVDFEYSGVAANTRVDESEMGALFVPFDITTPAP